MSVWKGEAMIKLKPCRACREQIDYEATICPKCRTKQSKGLGLMGGLAIGFLGIIALGSLGQGEPETQEFKFENGYTSTAAEFSTEKKAASGSQDVASEGLTASQRNALRSATSYLSMTGFSRDGLIDQLSSDAGEGYSIEDATAAVDSLNVDWNANAAKSAKEYLDMTGFSCKGLIEQLSSSAGSQYTVEQATYGAQSAGAC
jgi:Host cell surface-exposed lipoprotein